MPKKVEIYKYIVCTDAAYLAPLKMMGPVKRPVKISGTDIMKMLMGGCHIAEYDFESKTYSTLTVEKLREDMRKANPSVPNKTTPQVIHEPEVEEEIPAKNPVEPQEIAPVIVEETPTAPVEEDENPKWEDEADTTVSKVDAYEFVLNEEGKVDESKINWSDFSKAERKALRARISEVNSKA